MQMIIMLILSLIVLAGCDKCEYDWAIHKEANHYSNKDDIWKPLALFPSRVPTNKPPRPPDDDEITWMGIT